MAVYLAEITKTKQLRNKNIDDARVITDKANVEKRELTADERTQRDRIMSAIDQQDADIAAYERLAAHEANPAATEDRSTGRPGLERRDRPGRRETRAHASEEYREDFRHFLATGERTGELSKPEARDITVAVPASGGFLLTPTQVSDDVVRQVDNMVYIKAKAKRYKVNGAWALGVRRKTARMSQPSWTTEIAAIPAADTSMAFDRRDLTPNLLVKLALVSTRMMDSGVEIETEVNEELAYQYATTEEWAFLNANGVGQALGVFNTTHPNAIASSGAGNRDITTILAGKLSADDFINVRYGMKQAYLKPEEAAWGLNRTVVGAARLLKDAQGRFIWKEGIASNTPDTILDLPFFMSEYVPGVIASGNYIGVLANWRYYGIAEVSDMRIQRLVELYAGTNEVGYKAMHWLDGQPLLDEAFTRLKVQ